MFRKAVEHSRCHQNEAAPRKSSPKFGLSARPVHPKSPFPGPREPEPREYTQRESLPSGQTWKDYCCTTNLPSNCSFNLPPSFPSTPTVI